MRKYEATHKVSTHADRVAESEQVIGQVMSDMGDKVRAAPASSEPAPPLAGNPGGQAQADMPYGLSPQQQAIIDSIKGKHGTQLAVDTNTASPPVNIAVARDAGQIAGRA